ncbi:hypothetical protein LKO27_07395 [Tessaracoccus sp. OS52]|uniref:hypothetical protein n=1 Tax=Tessaracoccus sp. OS52 TaxID=2886691 RepID=UPI001D1136F0|nr:hypothetical protein [Tessaracoccus sp. OS52]MCC2593231.1 hypothetical protein [Tessaracoccus sp. OS52]
MANRSRLALSALTCTLLLLGLSPNPATAETPTGTPVDAAAKWLLDEAPNGTLPNFLGDPDWGLTTDAALGLAAVGASEVELEKFRSAVEGAIRDGNYGYYDLGDGSTYIDAGGVAKVLLIAAQAGADSRAYGGRDLVATLRGELAGGRLAGANTFGQSYAIMGLAAVGENVEEAVSFLLQQQCPSGDFRLTPSTQPCTSTAENADRDTTAVAIRALRAAADLGAGVDVEASLTKAVDWLVSDQEEDGGWIGSRWTATPNTNSTGLAAYALAGLSAEAVTKAAGWTASLQLTSGDDAGAVAYDADAFAVGMSPNSRPQWHRATSQALYALAAVAAVDPEPTPEQTPTATATVTATATATTTVTATAGAPTRPTASPAPGRDLYETPGFHTSGGRRWMTVCEPYSLTTRCWTYIWASAVHETHTGFAQVQGWQFNNLTYVASTRSAWAGNPLGNTGNWVAGDGRRWRTECDTAVSGRNGCRSYVTARVIQRSGDTYQYKTTEIFNNIVRFS